LNYRFIQIHQKTINPYERPYQTTQYFSTEEDARNAMLSELKRQMYWEKRDFLFFDWDKAYAAYEKDGHYRYPYNSTYSYLSFDGTGATLNDVEYKRTYKIEKVDPQKDAERLAKANEGNGSCKAAGIGCIVTWLIMLFADPSSMHPVKFFGVSAFLLLGLLFIALGSTVTQDDIDNGRG